MYLVSASKYRKHANDVAGDFITSFWRCREILSGPVNISANKQLKAIFYKKLDITEDNGATPSPRAFRSALTTRHPERPRAPHERPHEPFGLRAEMRMSTYLPLFPPKKFVSSPSTLEQLCSGGKSPQYGGH